MFTRMLTDLKIDRSVNGLCKSFRKYRKFDGYTVNSVFKTHSGKIQYGRN